MKSSFKRLLGKLFVALKGLNWIESVYFQLSGNRYGLPPRRLRGKVGAPEIEEFLLVSYEFASWLKVLCGLKPYHNILEVGCGVGRTCLGIADYIKEPGLYDGFDIDEELIDYANGTIGRKNPAFKFRWFNVYNSSYNDRADAIPPEKFRFPYEDQQFDLVYLTSVFTHMFPPGINNYVKEIGRVLRCGGKCFATFFLLDNHPTSEEMWQVNDDYKRLVSLDSNSYPDQFKFKVMDPSKPESFVAYNLEFIDELFNNCGMKRILDPKYGRWSGNPEFLSYQDILIYEKIV